MVRLIRKNHGGLELVLAIFGRVGDQADIGVGQRAPRIDMERLVAQHGADIVMSGEEEAGQFTVAVDGIGLPHLVQHAVEVFAIIVV